MNFIYRRISAFCLALTAFAASAATIDSVLVRQQWPWSTDVRVEYSVSGITDPVDITIAASNGAAALDAAAVRAASKGDLHGISADGVYSFTIDPIAAFGTDSIALSSFTVTLGATPSPANIHEKIYKIVDLTSPYAVTDITRADLLNGKYGACATSFSEIDPAFTTSLPDVLIWLDVTNDVYKTDKMVFRRIEAGGQSFMFMTNNASVNGGAGIRVSFGKDYYMGVFEVTQAQYHHFVPSTTSYLAFETNALYSATRPQDKLRYATYNRATARWPENTSHDLTSLNNGVHTFVPKLQVATGLMIDLPTEAMWEFACRAGTTTVNYTGSNGSDFAKVGRFASTWPGFGSITENEMRNCTPDYVANIVGRCKPNAYGLYDMLGNCWEWCLDLYVGTSSLVHTTASTDPAGPTAAQQSQYQSDAVHSTVANSKRVLRGGAYNQNINGGCSFRYADWAHYDTRTSAVRLCIWLDNNDDGTLQ